MKNDQRPLLKEAEAQRLPPDIIESLTTAMKLAQGGTGGGRSMAQVLLCAYHGGRFPLDLSELRNLDEKNFDHALNVIRLRYIGYEPHTLFVDGGSLFEKIASDWRFEA